MITQIGLIAGEIWEHLDKNNKEVELGELMAGVNKERDLVLMSIGWLAREGHVVLEGEGEERRVRLID
ncbi:MAG: winged helix-turn-helix domain-containing protein [Candidatus Omnitrophica bacterium]|nr:winged helix-turn-helix domain-containing protein [Candidatus Omnitrophota bacterium]